MSAFLLTVFSIYDIIYCIAYTGGDTVFQKIKSKASSILRKNLTENKVIATYEEEGVTYKVIDTLSSSSLYKSQRSLKFKTADSNIVYTHSSIYLDTEEKIQPYLPIGQEIISRWCEAFSPKSALVLGCAGCAIPRFLCLSYSDIRVTGVEISPLLIHIAKELFLLRETDDRFALIEGDAFRYVKDCISATEDIILVDIFDKNRLPDEVFSSAFISDIIRTASDNSLILFNFIDSNPKNVKSFAEEIKLSFGEKYLISTETRCFLAVGKSENSQKLGAFYKSLNNCEKIG